MDDDPTMDDEHAFEIEDEQIPNLEEAPTIEEDEIMEDKFDMELENNEVLTMCMLNYYELACSIDEITSAC